MNINLWGDTTLALFEGKAVYPLIGVISMPRPLAWIVTWYKCIFRHQRKG